MDHMRRLLFALHIIITLAFTFLPVLFSWWINILIYLLWYVHLSIFGGCVLNIAEYGSAGGKEFGVELLKKLGIRMSSNHYLFFSRYVQAPLCIGLSLLWQIVLGFRPLIF
jgi:hypothetical protein